LARRCPEVKGATHAWVGIIAGGLFGAFYLIVLAGFIAMAGYRAR
jgi:hypothetical protein